MQEKKSVIGKVFDQLTVLQEEDKVTTGTHRRAECLCSCGKTKWLTISSLVGRYHNSCGCQKAARIGELNKTHGKSKSPVYLVWKSMKKRCMNPKDPSFHRYGGRGITVCDTWIDSFEQFMLDMGERTANLSIERIDNNQGYNPSNCRWATDEEQRSNKRNTMVFEYRGLVFKTAKDLASYVGIKTPTLTGRLSRGKSIEEAVKPVSENRRKLHDPKTV